MMQRYLIIDLPRMLTKDVGEDVNLRRLKLAMHREEIPYKATGTITQSEYRRLYVYFYDRKLVEAFEAYEQICVVGQANAEKVLDKSVLWIIELRHGNVQMKMRDYMKLVEFARIAHH